MKFEIYNYFSDATQHAKFIKVSFLFSFFHHAHRPIVGHIRALNTPLYVIPANEVPFGLRRMKNNILFPLLPKKRESLAVKGK